MHSQNHIRHFLKNSSLGASCLGVWNSPPAVQFSPNLMASQRKDCWRCVEPLGLRGGSGHYQNHVRNFPRKVFRGAHCFELLPCPGVHNFAPPPVQSSPNLVVNLRRIHWTQTMFLAPLGPLGHLSPSKHIRFTKLSGLRNWSRKSWSGKLNSNWARPVCARLSIPTCANMEDRMKLACLDTYTNMTSIYFGLWKSSLKQPDLLREYQVGTTNIQKKK